MEKYNYKMNPPAGRLRSNMLKIGIRPVINGRRKKYFTRIDDRSMV
jgi:hypothetical protein